MIDLEPMWLALAKYQPYADADGHGESWRRMCEERTYHAAITAAELAPWADVCFAAEWAGDAAGRAASATDVAVVAIKRIEKVRRERGDVPS